MRQVSQEIAKGIFMATQATRWVLGHRVTPVETGSDFGLLSIVSPAKAGGPPPHYHNDAVELFLILEGRMEVMCDDTWHSLKAGESFLVPKGSVHTFRNPDEVEVKWITTFAPKGFERFFEDFGVPVERSGAQEESLSGDMIQQVIARCGSYGMILAAQATPGEGNGAR